MNVKLGFINAAIKSSGFPVQAGKNGDNSRHVRPVCHVLRWHLC